jgi:hypothetical protein
MCVLGGRFEATARLMFYNTHNKCVQWSAGSGVLMVELVIAPLPLTHSVIRRAKLAMWICAARSLARTVWSRCIYKTTAVIGCAGSAVASERRRGWCSTTRITSACSGARASEFSTLNQ